MTPTLNEGGIKLRLGLMRINVGLYLFSEVFSKKVRRRHKNLSGQFDCGVLLTTTSMEPLATFSDPV